MLSSLLIVPALIFLLISCSIGAASGACFSHLFAFGDSIVDTGNLAFISPNSTNALKPPYGETFIHHPTGRFCNGRLIVDFMEEAFKMPFLIPYFGAKTARDFQFGANFAVSGATALNNITYFEKLGVNASVITPFSLEVQIELFDKVLQLLASSDQEREEIRSTSLFFIGMCGGNGYNYPFFFGNVSTAQVKPLVPLVTAITLKSIQVLIKLGAKTIVVPSYLPNGCTRAYLSLFESKNPIDYDEFGCLKAYNQPFDDQNLALKLGLRQLRRDYPNVTIIYADLFAAVSEISTHPLQYGFGYNSTLVAIRICFATIHPNIFCGIAFTPQKQLTD